MAELIDQLNRLKAALQMTGEQDEGTSGSRGDLFNPSDTYQSFTWPKDIELVDDQGEGILKYSYDAMIRHKHYVAKAETATNDDNFSGVIVAKYQISRKATLAFQNNIEFQPSQQRDVGNSIVSRIRSLDGITL